MNKKNTQTGAGKSTAAHTPGRFAFDPVTRFIATDETHSMTIAEVFTDIPEGEGNGYLLAAAPEMLEALKNAACLIKCARQYFPKSMHNGNKFELEKINAMVCAAISKAEGVQS